VRRALEDHQDALLLWKLDDLHRIGRRHQARPAWRQAVAFGVVLRLVGRVVVVDCSSPGLKRHLRLRFRSAPGATAAALPAAQRTVAAAAPAAGAPAGDGAATEEESATVDVVLTEAGDKKIQVIKVVRAATGLGLKEAKALVDEAPKPVREGIDREEAEKLKGEREEAGAGVELK
jgi:large subunit ribosomal protein L7/L12